MNIYSCNTSVRTKLAKLAEYRMGVLVSTHPDETFAKSFLNQNLDDINGITLDNGAFACHKNGLPWSEYAFLWHLNYCTFKKIMLDFVVVPDRVGAGLESLEFSLMWKNRLIGCRLALAVQDGMTPDDINADDWDYIFVGGTPEWKWQTVEDWVKFAHDHDLRCHVGQVGTLSRMEYCRLIGVDSIDSTNFVRNDDFTAIEKLKTQTNIFE